MEAARAGNPAGMAQLYERYYGPMAALAWSVLGDHHLAEDAAQQAFAVACDRLGRLRKKEKFAGWLAGICRNTAREMVRSQRKAAPPEPLPETNAPTDGENHDGQVRRAIRQLPDRAREVIVLRYYNNLPYDRIGAVLGVSEAAVHGRLIRAKRKIKKYLEQNGFEGNES